MQLQVRPWLAGVRQTWRCSLFLLQNLREDPSARNLDLSSYLLVPSACARKASVLRALTRSRNTSTVQRLTRYPLLIRQILNYTDTSLSTSGAVGPRDTTSSTSWSDVAERESISVALQTSGKILEEVNETIRDQEGRERLREISRALWIGQGRLDLTAPTRHLGPRKLIKEGVLTKARSGRKLRAVLCSDILVLVDEGEKGLYRVVSSFVRSIDRLLRGFKLINPHFFVIYW